MLTKIQDHQVNKVINCRSFSKAIKLARKYDILEGFEIHPDVKILEITNNDVKLIYVNNQLKTVMY